MVQVTPKYAQQLHVNFEAKRSGKANTNAYFFQLIMRNLLIIGVG